MENYVMVKELIHGDSYEAIPPKLEVELNGKEFVLVNFRDYYFTTMENTLAGRAGQVDSSEAYDYEVEDLIIECIQPLVSEKIKGIKDDKELALEFMTETSEFYLGN